MVRARTEKKIPVNMVKQFLVKVMASTGAALVVLAVIATIIGGRFLFISSVFESLLASLVIHCGFLLTRKFESRYAVLEELLDLSYMILILIMFGAVFDWYRHGTPAGILVIIAVAIYLIGVFLSLFRTNEEINTINQLLQESKFRNKTSSESGIKTNTEGEEAWKQS